MKKLTLLSLSVVFTPIVTHAQSESVQNVLINIAEFFNTTVIPFLLGLGFLFFVVNAVRYFIIGGNNEQEQEKAKALALYSVLAFVIIIAFWGIINVLIDGIGLGGSTQPTQDYMNLKSVPMP